jgi:hypothetical protein
MDFNVAKRSAAANKAASKAAARWKVCPSPLDVFSHCQDLSKIIELDAVSFSILDLAPQDEYSLYMRSFGQGFARQAACQAGEDRYPGVRRTLTSRVDRDAQTDPIEVADTWTQNPASDLAGCGSSVPVAIFTRLTALQRPAEAMPAVSNESRGLGKRCSAFTSR